MSLLNLGINRIKPNSYAFHWGITITESNDSEALHKWNHTHTHTYTQRHTVTCIHSDTQWYVCTHMHTMTHTRVRYLCRGLQIRGQQQQVRPRWKLSVMKVNVQSVDKVKVYIRQFLLGLHENITGIIFNWCTVYCGFCCGGGWWRFISGGSGCGRCGRGLCGCGVILTTEGREERVVAGRKNYTLITNYRYFSIHYWTMNSVSVLKEVPSFEGCPY